MTGSDRKLKVVLTGTTGNLGSTVLKHVQTYIPRSSIIVSLFNSTRGPADVDGIEIRNGNYDDPQSLDKAYDGADILFLMSYPSIRSEMRTNAHRNAIEAAIRTSIKYIVYTSLALCGPPSSMESVAPAMDAHLATELLLKTKLPSTMSYTIIREGIYTEYFPAYLGFYDISQKPSEVFIPPGDDDCLIAFTRRADLGEATAKVIQRVYDDLEGNEYVNRTIMLTAEPKYSLRSVGEVIGNILGTPPVKINYIPLDILAAPEGPASLYLGGPELVRAAAMSYVAVGKGEASYVGEGSRELERILGRKPEDLEVTLRQMFAANP